MKALKRLRRKIKYNRKVNSIVMFFFVLFLFMGVGYAYLNATLSITGTGKVTKTTWDVHFENIEEIDGSVSPTSAPVISNDTTVSFSATLNEPGDFYSFDIDLVNAGTIDATIGSLDISPTLTTEQQEYFEYKIKYKGDNSLDVREGDALSHGNTKTIEILFRYKELDNHDLYPDEDVNFNFTITINAVQGTFDKEGSVLKSTYSGDTSDFRNYNYLAYIRRLILDDHINPPSGYIESWDVSEGQNGNVMAYLVTNSQDNTMYDLYIQGNGYLYAPEDSSYLFAHMESLREIVNLRILDTSNVTNMSNMFGYTSGVEVIDVSNFDTSKVTNMSAMFVTVDDYYRNLKYIEGLEYFNTSNVTDMSYMFHYQKSLETINIRSFNTSKVTNMSHMFQDCQNLDSLFLDYFDTSKVTDMSFMFAGCDSFYTLYLNSFDTSHVTDMSYMFSSDINLEHIYVNSTFVTNNVTNSNYMFSNCTSIVGESGTTYSSSHIDKTYARIDYVGSPGYFCDGGVQ